MPAPHIELAPRVRRTNPASTNPPSARSRPRRHTARKASSLVAFRPDPVLAPQLRRRILGNDAGVGLVAVFRELDRQSVRAERTALRPGEDGFDAWLAQATLRRSWLWSSLSLRGSRYRRRPCYRTCGISARRRHASAISRAAWSPLSWRTVRGLCRAVARLSSGGSRHSNSQYDVVIDQGRSRAWLIGSPPEEAC